MLRDPKNRIVKCDERDERQNPVRTSYAAAPTTLFRIYYFKFIDFKCLEIAD